MKLRRRINIVIAESIAAIAVICIIIIIPVQKNYAEITNRKLISLMQTFITRDTSGIANAIFENRKEALDIRMKKIREIDDIRDAVVFDSSCRMLSTPSSSISEEKLKPRFEEALYHLVSTWVENDSLWYLQNIVMYDESLGFVLIEYSLEDMNIREIQNVLIFTWTFFLITAALLLIINTVIRKTIISPVNHLIENMSDIVDGYYGGQIEIKSDDEIGELARNFNKMSSQISYSYNNVLNIRYMMENIIDSMPSILFSVDERGLITAWNTAAEKYTGIGREKAAGEVFTSVFPLFEDYKSSVESVLKEKIPEFFKMEKAGQFYFDISIFPLISTDTSGAVIRLDDITEAEKREELLRQSQKMETIGTLAGGLAHDFNNVLGGIVGTTSLIKYKLEQGDLKPEELSSDIDMIERSSERASGMVNKLLTISKKYRLEMGPVNLNTAAGNVISICRNTFDKKITIHTDYYPGDPVIYGDANQIEQILLNICVNASHAMSIMRKDEDYGGMLSLTIRKASWEDVSAVAGKSPDQDYFKITVSDTGVGISPENLKSVFDPFFTTKSEGTGTGLGLSMVYNMIKKHAGYIDVESETGKGTDFRIYLPEDKKRSPDSGEEVVKKELIHGEGSVLVVDDEKIIRDTTRDMLLLCGYRVLCASGGAEGLEILEQNRGGIDLVILDMAMPDMSGKEVFIEIRKLYPEIKILMASGFSHDKRVLDVINGGVDGFINKPFNIRELAEKVHNLIS